jgi:transcriptional regulator with XRE-family HTH domain
MSVHPITSLRGSRSIEWLAQESGVPPTTIARIETGITRVPFRRTLDQLAGPLCVSASDLELSIAKHNHALATESAA